MKRSGGRSCLNLDLKNHEFQSCSSNNNDRSCTHRSMFHNETFKITRYNSNCVSLKFKYNISEFFFSRGKYKYI